MWRLLRRFWCAHDDELTESIDGVCLGWDARPQVIRRFRRTCAKCGRTTSKTGYLIGDPVKRDRGDWPLNAAGKRIAIVKR